MVGRLASGLAAVIVLLTVFAAAGADEPLAAEPPAAAEDPLEDQKDAHEILNMDLDQLSKVEMFAPSTGVAPTMEAEVTSVSKQESTLGRSPAAVFVITNEMIRRSGATSIPEVLRMAPGLEVARINSSTWAIAARGFNGYFTGKLLVLIALIRYIPRAATALRRWPTRQLAPDRIPGGRAVCCLSLCFP